MKKQLLLIFCLIACLASTLCTAQNGRPGMKTTGGPMAKPAPQPPATQRQAQPQVQPQAQRAPTAAPEVKAPPPAFSPSDKKALLTWIGKMAAAAKVTYCYRKSYGRGVGTPLTACPSGTEKDGALCYPNCTNNYKGVGPVCWQRCPSGFRDDGAYCAKPAPYGRGSGYAIWDEKKCKKQNSQGCEKNGAMYYPRCRDGFHATGCCICSPNCTDGMTDIGVSCQKKSYGRGAGSPMKCEGGKDEDAGLCYNRCNDGYHGVGPVCWQNCPNTQPVDCAAGCATTKQACADKTSNMVIATLSLAANIASCGEASEVNAAKSAVTTSIKAAKNGEKGAVATAKELKNTAKAALDHFAELGFAKFEQMTSKRCADLLRNKYSRGVFEWIAKEYVKVNYKVATSDAFTTEDLRDLAGLDPTGVAEVAEAYTQPICSFDLPMPDARPLY